MTATVIHNSLRDGRAWPPAPLAVADFHRRMPAYEPSPLFDAPDLATDLGIGRLLVRRRHDVWDCRRSRSSAHHGRHQAICAHMGSQPEPRENINELAANVAHLKPVNLAAATDGNHGRAVAFMARLLGFEAEIFRPVRDGDGPNRSDAERRRHGHRRRRQLRRLGVPFQRGSQRTVSRHLGKILARAVLSRHPLREGEEPAQSVPELGERAVLGVDQRSFRRRDHQSASGCAPA